jgi:PAS domain S-box-containing protein
MTGMKAINKTKPTNLSTLYPDLAQTVQLEHFADLLQKLFHANSVTIYLENLHVDCFVSSSPSADWDTNLEITTPIKTLHSSNAVPAISNGQYVQNISRKFQHGNNLSGWVLLEQLQGAISDEQDAALQWMLDCITNYLTKQPIEQLVLDYRVCNAAQLSEISDSVFSGNDQTITWCCRVSESQTSLTIAEFSKLVGPEVSAWLTELFESEAKSGKVRIQQSQNVAICAQLLWWKGHGGNWILQVQNISLANQLRQTQQHLAFLQSLFTSGIAAMIGINDRHQVVYANAQARELLLISQATDRLKAPLDLAYLQFYEPEHQALGPQPPFGDVGSAWENLCEHRRLVRYPSGEEKVVSMWFAPHNDLQSPEIVAYCLLLDMTEQHQLQCALQDMQEHIDSLLHFSPAAIYQAFTNISHGFMYISPNIEKITGFSQSEVMNDPSFWPRHVHPDDLALVLSEDPIEENAIEYRLFNVNQQRYIWVKDIRNHSPEEGDEHIVFGALLDIHARKEAELEQVRLRRELEDNKMELSQSLDSMVDAVITLNEEGYFLSCNPATSALFGFSFAELRTMQFVDLLVTPEIFTRFFSEVISVNDQQIDQRALEFSAKNKAGQSIHFSCTMAELPKNATRARRFVACLHDLTEFKAQQEQLIQAGKLSALGTLTSGIAHDFNNILGIIRGYAEMLSLRSEQQVANYAQNIIKAADRGAAMTKNLLDFSSNKSRDIIKIDVNQLINDMRDMLFEAVTKRITLKINLTDEQLPSEMEKGGLENALLNLVINARHAIPDLGQIDVSTERVQLNHSQAAALDLPVGNYCCVRVKDSGGGMTDEVQQRLFEPFFTTKGTQGTGLGLAQVFGFCRRCRGTVRVNSSIGVGTEFTMLFPYIESKFNKESIIVDLAIKPRMTSTQNSKAKSNKQILLVDDEEDLLEVNAMLLESAGYEVVTVNSMKSAIARLQTTSFDLVLSDIVMPNGSGLQLAAYIQQHYPDVPIQLVSGFAEESMIADESCRRYFDSRLQKPFTTATLLNKVAEILTPSTNL